MDAAIIDLGYCEKLSNSNKAEGYNVGSPAYMSPEAYNNNYYSEKSDVWALGVMLHEMLTGTIPVMRTKDVDKYFASLKKMDTAEIVPNVASTKVNEMMKAMLKVNMPARISISQLRTMLTEIFGNP